MIYYSNNGGNNNMKKYFNYEEKEKAIKLIEIDPYEAEYLLNRYLQKYPTDLAAKAHLIYVLIVLNKIELAELIIEELEKNYKVLEDKNIVVSTNTVGKLNSLAKILFLFSKSVEQFSLINLQPLFFPNRIKPPL